MKRLSIFLLSTSVLLAVACGSDGEVIQSTSISPTRTLGPTSTPTSVTSTPTPAPTIRPNQAVVRGPTPTPVDYVPPTLPAGSDYQYTDVKGLSPEAWELNGYGVLKPPPAELEQTSEPLSTDTVIELWTEVIGDTRLIVNGNPVHPDTGAVLQIGDFDLVFCSAGYGVVMDVPPSEGATGVGVVFDWSIEHSPASSWWSSILRFDVRVPDFVPAYTEGGTGGAEAGTYRRPVFIIGDEILIDSFTGTELEVSLLTMTDPDQFCSDTGPEDVRLF